MEWLGYFWWRFNKMNDKHIGRCFWEREFWYSGKPVVFSGIMAFLFAIPFFGSLGLWVYHEFIANVHNVDLPIWMFGDEVYLLGYAAVFFIPFYSFAKHASTAHRLTHDCDFAAEHESLMHSKWSHMKGVKSEGDKRIEHIHRKSIDLLKEHGYKVTSM